ncbi:MAG: CpsB/CapC family capsule biosynthesis tyrosine phosphatase [Lachnospiraceae bacterium]
MNKETRRMIDIHMHIIPSVDDGSWSMDMSKTMLMMAYCQGTTTVFATPHSSAFIYDKELVRTNFAALQREMIGSPFQNHLYLGCEVLCNEYNITAVLDYLHDGTLPTMNGTSYVLTEFSTRIQSDEARKMIDLLQAEKWQPIIAHVERYPFLFLDDTIDDFIKKGCLLQINAYSLERETNLQIKERARKLLKEGKVTFLGSDGHRTNHRPPSVESGVDYIYESCDKVYADAVVFGNAQRLLINGEDVGNYADSEQQV